MLDNDKINRLYWRVLQAIYSLVRNVYGSPYKIVRTNPPLTIIWGSYTIQNIEYHNTHHMFSAKVIKSNKDYTFLQGPTLDSLVKDLIEDDSEIFED